jgi:hypothetical protein
VIAMLLQISSDCRIGLILQQIFTDLLNPAACSKDVRRVSSNGVKNVIKEV